MMDPEPLPHYTVSDYCLEIVPPATAIRDERLKLGLYRREGVSHYVLIYPERKVAKVCPLQNGRFVKRADVVREILDFDLAGDGHIEFDFSRIRV